MIKDVIYKPLVNPRFVKPKLMEFTQNGLRKSWEIVEVHNSVAILIFNKTRDEFILVKQFRPAIYKNSGDGYSYELCAGIIDKDKSIEEIAKEEVFEETGYDVLDLTLHKITSSYTSVGFGGGKQWLFYIEVSDKNKKSAGGGVDGEMIEIVTVGIDKAKEFIFDESKPKTPGLMFAFYWYFDTILNKNN